MSFINQLESINLKNHLAKLITVLFSLTLVACGSDSSSTNELDTSVELTTPDSTVGNESTDTEFTLSSDSMVNNGNLPVTFTCDGDSISPPLTWSGPPKNTVEYALIMHHVPGPDEAKWYWLMYGIDTGINSIDAGEIEGVLGTNNGNGVIDYIKSNRVDLMLLDLMLPDVNGFDICKQLRVFSSLPVIMVTTKSEEIDKLFGLEFGADDYICKPFNPREVIARIKAVLRRFENNSDDKANETIIQQSGFEIDCARYQVSFKNHLLDLTPIEFKIVELFLNNVERPFSRDEIMNKVYLDTIDVSDRNIDTHIKNIRKKIHQHSSDSNPIY